MDYKDDLSSMSPEKKVGGVFLKPVRDVTSVDSEWEEAQNCVAINIRLTVERHLPSTTDLTSDL